MGLYCYPSNIGDVNSQPAAIQFQWFTRDNLKYSVPGDTTILYMPQEANQPSTVSWNSESFGAAGREAYNKARGLSTAGFAEGAATGVGAQLATTIGESISSRAKFLTGALTGDASAEDMVSATMSQLKNPYLTMVFKGVNFRSFSFQFKFIPFNPGDTNVIYAIMQSFRKNSLPQKNAGGGLLGYPSECEIQYLWQGKPNLWLNRFKRSVCTKVDVNYTAQGMWAATRDGFPASITMTVDFTELDIVTSEDVETSIGASTGQSY